LSGKFTFKWFTGYKIHEDDVKGRGTRIDHNNSRFLTSIYLPIILEYIKYKNWYWSKNTYTKFVILTITGLVCQIRTAVMIFNWRGCPDVDTDVQVNIYQTLTRIAVFPKFSGYLFWQWISQAIVLFRRACISDILWLFVLTMNFTSNSLIPKTMYF
jgi:hypothetical protein